MKLRLLKASPFYAVRAPIDLRFCNVRLRDGTIILGALNPSPLGAPGAAPTASATGGGTTGGLLQAGAYFIKYTNLTVSGETPASPELASAITVSAGNIPTVTMASVPAGVISRNIYITAAGGSTNTETLYATQTVAGTTFNLAAAYQAGGVIPPTTDTSAGYAAGVTTIAVSGLTSILTNGFNFTIGRDPTVYKITGHTETLGITTGVTFTPVLAQNVGGFEEVLFGPHVMTIKVGEGNLTFSEKKPRTYFKDRGRLDSVRNADDEPMDVKFELTWEFLEATTGSGVPTVEDVLKNRGEAAGWVTAGADPCEPFAVDIQVEYIPQCPGVQREIYDFKEFRYEDLAHDFKQSQISVTGKCKIIEAGVRRSA